MSEATDKWIKASNRFKDAKSEAHRVQSMLRGIADQFRSWSGIAPGSVNTIVIPGFSQLPTVQKLSELAAEINSSVLDEFNAWNQVPPDERSHLKRE
ncbi:MAG: hypothetical protein WCD12_20620 [Candidatus Binatus sp.]|uniref:hypothetical protein n=1 Tax=Candidatus Binatus sp. TaxID=2811406 RepID=UPI003C727BF8